MPEAFDRTTPVSYVSYVQWGPVMAGGAITCCGPCHCVASLSPALSDWASEFDAPQRGGEGLDWALAPLRHLLNRGRLGLLWTWRGYVAGLLRERFGATPNVEEVELRDGVHGLLVWALATLFTALLLLLAASAATRLAAPSGGAAGPSTSVAGENTVAFDIDRLLRGERRPGDAADITHTRAEVGRILLTASGHSGVAAEDRGYLIRLVAARTASPRLKPKNVSTPPLQARGIISLAHARAQSSPPSWRAPLRCLAPLPLGSARLLAVSTGTTKLPADAGSAGTARYSASISELGTEWRARRKLPGFFIPACCS